MPVLQQHVGIGQIGQRIMVITSGAKVLVEGARHPDPLFAGIGRPFTAQRVKVPAMRFAPANPFADSAFGNIVVMAGVLDCLSPSRCAEFRLHDKPQHRISLCLGSRLVRRGDEF